MAFLYLSVESLKSLKYSGHKEYVLAFSCLSMGWEEDLHVRAMSLGLVEELGHRTVGSWLPGQKPGSLEHPQSFPFTIITIRTYSSTST